MGVFFFIINTIVQTTPPPKAISGQIINPPPASKSMATMLYSYVCFYSMHTECKPHFLGPNYM